MEPQAKTTSTNYLQSEKMEPCICGVMEVSFYCTSPTYCMRNGEQQPFFCLECAETFHHHGVLTIAKANARIGQQWASLFAQLESTHEKVTDIFKNIGEFVRYCEDGNRQLPNQLRDQGDQSCSRDYNHLNELYEQIIIKKRQEIEQMIANIKLKDILPLEKTRKDYQGQINELRYLEDITAQMLYQRYRNVFINKTKHDYKSYSKKILDLIISFKDEAMDSVQTIDPQSKQQSDVIQQQIQINCDKIQIVDHKTEKQDQRIDEQEKQIASLNRAFQFVRMNIKFEWPIKLIKQTKLPNNHYLRTFCQLKDSNLILCGDSAKQLQLIDPITLDIKYTINTTSDSSNLWHVIEHNNYMFAIDNDYSIFMIDKHSNQEISKYKGGNDKRYIQILDVNTLITFNTGGQIQYFDIQNNKITLKKQQKLLDGHLLQSIRIGNSNQYLVREKDKGIQLIEYNQSEFTKQHTFLSGKHVTSMVMYSADELLCSHDSKYYKVNITTKTETEIIKGDNQSYELVLVPGFSLDQLPFIISREHQWISMINIKTNQYYKLFDYQCEFYYNTANSLIFLRNQGYKFVTFGKKSEVLLFDLNDLFTGPCLDLLLK